MSSGAQLPFPGHFFQNDYAYTPVDPPLLALLEVLSDLGSQLTN